MIKSWSDEAWEEFEYWTKNDKKIFKRILELIKDIDRNGYTGIGKPEPLKYDLSGYWSRELENCKSNFCFSEKFDGSSREEIREYIKQAKKVGALESVSLPNYETESQLNQITENIYNQCSVNNSCPRLVNQKDIKEFYGYYYLEKQENNINNEKNRLKSVCANDICFSKEEFETTFIKEQNIRKEAGQNNRKSYKFRYAR